jgi:hypothetical protein
MMLGLWVCHAAFTPLEQLFRGSRRTFCKGQFLPKLAHAHHYIREFFEDVPEVVAGW